MTSITCVNINDVTSHCVDMTSITCVNINDVTSHCVDMTSITCINTMETQTICVAAILRHCHSLFCGFCGSSSCSRHF